MTFALGLWSMFKPFQNCNVYDETQPNTFGNDTLYCIDDDKLTRNQGFRGILSVLFWTIFDGDFSNVEVIVNKDHPDYNNTTRTQGNEFSLEFSHLMGLTIFAVYQGLTVILLINLLIAMMNSTYSILWDNADMEWKYSRTYFQV